MTEFTELPLQKLLNRQNILSRVENLERGKVRPSAVVQQLGQIGGNTGNLIVDGEIVVPNRDNGLPDVRINDNGITIRNQQGAFFFDPTVAGSGELSIYSSGADDLVLRNSVGGKTIAFDVDDASHNVAQHYFDYDGLHIDGALYINYDNPIQDGWFETTDTATQASATTFTVPDDRTGVFRPYTKFACVNSTTKYGTILASSYSAPNTTVTLATNSDYALTTDAITSPQVSPFAHPLGFPYIFNWSPAPANLTTGNGTLTAKYQIQGRQVFGHLEFVFGNTSAVTGDVTFTLPVTQGTYGAVSAPIGLVRLIAGGAGSIGTCVAPTTTTARIAVNTASGTYVSNAVLSSTVPGTWTTADVIQAQFSYFI
jgi:hypothetical protein